LGHFFTAYFGDISAREKEDVEGLHYFSLANKLLSQISAS